MLEDADVYGHVTSRFYDAVYGPMREGSGDLGFYRELALQAGGPVLELGCGTGRVLLPIAGEGMPCTGLDVSPRMLDTLRRKETPPTLRLVCAPMQDFDLGEVRFMLIYAAFRVFQHLYTAEDQLACLSCVRRHLAPGGSFAFDVFSPDPERTSQSHEDEAQDARLELEGETIVRYTSVDRDHTTRVLTAHMRYERTVDGEVRDNEHIDVRMRYFWVEELIPLLERAGFRDVVFYGDFDRSPHGEGSPEIIVVAKS